MKIKEVNINRIRCWNKNPRDIHQQDLGRLKAQIQRLGVYKPLVAVSENGRYVVLGGNMRLRALQELGFKKVEISVVRAPTEKERIEYALSDNDRAGFYVGEKLEELIRPYEGDLDLSEFKVDLDVKAMNLNAVLDQFSKKEPEENFDLDKTLSKIKKPKSKRGEVYQLGRHRLMCGDATSREDVEKLMDGEKADMVFTDPPYGIDLDTDFSEMKGIAKGKKYEKIKGDENIYNPQHLFQAFKYCKEIFLWGADYYAELIPNRNGGCFFVWDKTESGVRTNSAYENQFGSNFELCWSKTKHKRQIVPCLWKGIFGLSREDTKKREHPAQKPVRLITWFLKEFSSRNKLIIDVFGGSGSTLIACEQTDRICYMMEIEPVYCDVIKERYKNYVGQKA